MIDSTFSIQLIWFGIEVVFQQTTTNKTSSVCDDRAKKLLFKFRNHCSDGKESYDNNSRDKLDDQSY